MLAMVQESENPKQRVLLGEVVVVVAAALRVQALVRKSHAPAAEALAQAQALQEEEQVVVVEVQDGLVAVVVAARAPEAGVVAAEQ